MKLKSLFVIAFAAFLGMFVISGNASAATKITCVRAPCYPSIPVIENPVDFYASGTIGVDMSWPNCQQSPPAGTQFGIVGVNYGLPYSENPCLAREIALFPESSRTYYINTAWYDQSPYLDDRSPVICAGDINCVAYNYGWNNVTRSLQSLESKGVAYPKMIWLDVETENTWNANTEQNRSSIQGAYDALQSAGIQSGVYSTTYQWGVITGGWQNEWKAWGATVENNAAAAATYCQNAGFTNAGFEMIQYIKDGLDHNYAC